MLNVSFTASSIDDLRNQIVAFALTLGVPFDGIHTAEASPTPAKGRKTKAKPEPKPDHVAEAEPVDDDQPSTSAEPEVRVEKKPEPKEPVTLKMIADLVGELSPSEEIRTKYLVPYLRSVGLKRFTEASPDMYEGVYSSLLDIKQHIRENQ